MQICKLLHDTKLMITFQLNVILFVGARTLSTLGCSVAWRLGLSFSLLPHI
jgi:hypothetical protein